MPSAGARSERGRRRREEDRGGGGGGGRTRRGGGGVGGRRWRRWVWRLSTPEAPTAAGGGELRVVGASKGQMLACGRGTPGQLPHLGRLGSSGGSGSVSGCPRAPCCSGPPCPALEFSFLCCSSAPFSPSASVPSSASSAASFPSHPPPPLPVLLPFSPSTSQHLATRSR